MGSGQTGSPPVRTTGPGSRTASNVLPRSATPARASWAGLRPAERRVRLLTAPCPVGASARSGRSRPGGDLQTSMAGGGARGGPGSGRRGSSRPPVAQPWGRGAWPRTFRFPSVSGGKGSAGLGQSRAADPKRLHTSVGTGERPGADAHTRPARARVMPTEASPLGPSRLQQLGGERAQNPEKLETGNPRIPTL